MRLARCETPAGPRDGVIERATFYELRGGHFGPREDIGRGWPLYDCRLLTPVQPTKVLGLMMNYPNPRRDAPPSEPQVFGKLPSAIIGPEEAIVLPPGTTGANYEGEMAIVIGKPASRVAPEEALDYVLGYTCCNDVTLVEPPLDQPTLTLKKGCDTFAPMGPHIETDLDPSDLVVETFVNGRRRQSDRTKHLIFDIPDALSFISRFVTLFPGDIITMGTPQGYDRLRPGDEVEVRVEGIGTLRNTVRAAETQA